MLSPDLQRMVLGPEPLADFVGSTVEGRNFWTHYDANEKAVPLTMPQASIAASRLLTLGVVTLLRQLGFADSEIHERMTATHSFLPVLAAYSFRDFPPEAEREEGSTITGPPTAEAVNAVGSTTGAESIKKKTPQDGKP